MILLLLNMPLQSSVFLSKPLFFLSKPSGQMRIGWIRHILGGKHKLLNIKNWQGIRLLNFVDTYYYQENTKQLNNEVK